MNYTISSKTRQYFLGVFSMFWLLQSNNDMQIKADWVSAKWSCLKKFLFLNLKPRCELWTKTYSQTSLPMAYCANKSFHIPKASQSTLIMPCFSYCILYFPQYCLGLLALNSVWWFLVVLSILPTQLLYPGSCNRGHPGNVLIVVIVCCSPDSLQLRMVLMKDRFSSNVWHS